MPAAQTTDWLGVTLIDWLVIVVYLLGITVIGVVLLLLVSAAVLWAVVPPLGGA